MCVSGRSKLRPYEDEALSERIRHVEPHPWITGLTPLPSLWGKGAGDGGLSSPCPCSWLTANRQPLTAQEK